MHIGEIRQELYELEAEIAVEEGRWRGYVRAGEEMKKSLRFRMIAAVVMEV